LRIAPLLESEWSQSKAQGQNCYNYYTPNNYVCGCVATAMAQVLRFHSHPTAGIGQITTFVYVNGGSTNLTTLGGDGLGGAYDWNQMPLIPTSAPYNSAHWQMIGRLCLDAGISVHMMYSSSGSGAYVSYVAPGLRDFFQYNRAVTSYAHSVNSSSVFRKILNSNLEAGYPVIMAISSLTGSGHMVDVDGYGFDGSTLYHHVNMGWGGSCDAWYTLPTVLGYKAISGLTYNVFPANRLAAAWLLNSNGTYKSGDMVSSTVFGSNISGMGEIDQDGTVDLILHNSDSGEVAYWLLDTDGSYKSGGSVTSTTITATLGGVGDIDRDGTGDLLWHDTTTGDVSYWLLNSDGSYKSGGSVTATTTLADLAGVGDIDQDGTIDIIWHDTSTGQVSYWLLNSDGTYKSGGQVYVGTLSSAWSLAGVGDIDQDGTVDIIWHNQSSGTVVFWLLNTDGTYKSGGVVTETTISSAWTVGGFGDIDLDGTCDIIWHKASTGQVVYWLLNTDGSLKSGGLVSSDTAPLSTTMAGVGDIDQDGVVDIVWQSNMNEIISGRVVDPSDDPLSGVTVTAQDQAGRFTYSDVTDDEGYYGCRVPSGTTFDLTASKADPRYPDSSLTGILTGTSSLNSACGNYYQADITMSLLPALTLTAAALQISIVLNWSDPTASGMPNSTVYIRRSTTDYPSTPSEGIEVYTGTAQTYEDTSLTQEQDYYYTIWVNDGSPYADAPDGSTDTATGTPDPGKGKIIWHNASSGQVVYWLLRDDGTYKSGGFVTDTTISSAWSLGGFGDIDQDGACDIVWHNQSSGQVVYWLLNKEGTYNSGGLVSESTISSAWRLGGFGDIDQDGTCDIVWHNQTSGQVVYWLLNSDGSYKSGGLVTATTISSAWTLGGFGDIDQDGTCDIVWHNQTSGQVVYWLLNSDGTYKSGGLVTATTISSAWSLGGFGDIDQDGTCDIVWHNQTSGQVVYWLLNSDGTLNSGGLVTETTISSAWRLGGFGDIDNDGTCDIVWHNQTSGQIVYWLLDSDGTYKSGGLVTPSVISSSWSLAGFGI